METYLIEENTSSPIDNIYEVYISKTKLKLLDIKDVMNNSVFDGVDENVEGWLVYYNPSVLFNWSHNVYFIFYINKKVSIHAKCNWWPKSIGDLVIITNDRGDM
jgi:hypothetical protein